jgi:SAM-dependent methyltransferase
VTGLRPLYHELKWTPEAVRRFWDYQNAHAAAEEGSFSRRFGARIVRLGLRGARVRGPVVDLGCGAGFLCEALLHAGHAVQAFDSSPAALERVRARFAGEPRLLGAGLAELHALPLGDGEAGAVFLVEVLEHLPRERWDPLVAEVARVLAPGGRFVLTTPHDEDLAAQRVACPECGAVFHRVQHVESVEAPSLRALLERHGLEVRRLDATNFRHFPDRPVWGRLVARLMRSLARLEARATPHLVAVAERPR